MFRVEGLGESGRAQVRMSAHALEPFEYSEDGRRWTPLDEPEDAAFRIYGLLDPRQVLNNLAAQSDRFPNRDSIPFDLKVQRDDEWLNGTMDLGDWFPELPPEYVSFLDNSRIQSVAIRLSDGRFAETVQLDLFPRSDDTIRVTFSYRPRGIVQILELVLDRLIGLIPTRAIQRR